MLVQILSGASLKSNECQMLFKPELIIRDSSGAPVG
jgi:hypothetical protein